MGNVIFAYTRTHNCINAFNDGMLFLFLHDKGVLEIILIPKQIWQIQWYLDNFRKIFDSKNLKDQIEN